ncbi:cytochrome P450 [Hyphodiscus hymeniophilus]|uniref:Cytochrome P450 n=1 Tax=Hyphodiscus hymeniophilus TaxID=353542 RepID=A0A9P6SMX5_9HELO|nr:cytochrome P450 [Hyphodiscus hymeniophilus]
MDVIILFDPTFGLPRGLLASLTTCAVIVYAGNHILLSSARRKFRREHGCQSIRSLPSSDPIWNISLVKETVKSLNEQRFLPAISDRFTKYGNTHEFYSNNHVIATCDPENIKCVLATSFRDFDLTSSRDGAFRPVIGHGIFTNSGPLWEESRKLLRPVFADTRLPDLDSLEMHLAILFKVLPRDSRVDLQEYFLRLLTDTTTDLVFGSNESCQTDGASELFGAMDVCTEKIHRVVQLGKMAKLFPDSNYRKSLKHVRRLADVNIARVTSISDDERKKCPSILDSIASKTVDHSILRGESLSLLFAGRDTNAALLGNLFFQLARHPHVWNRLRDEILFLRGKKPTAQQLKSVKYVTYCLNEALRLHPVVPLNARTAVRDCVLPVGSGRDGKSPVFVEKGAVVFYSTYSMHRREDIWGTDTDLFKPERWVGSKRSWDYLPFNGGPRICIGQQFALKTAAYILIRMVQEFETIESRDSRPWVEGLSLTCSSGNGTQVTLH